MIDSLTEEILSLTDAAKTLPTRRNSRRPHVSCLYRWTVSGCRGVILESIQIGGTRCTSREALARFFERLTGPMDTPDSATVRTVHRRERDSLKAERELRELGV